MASLVCLFCVLREMQDLESSLVTAMVVVLCCELGQNTGGGWGGQLGIAEFEMSTECLTDVCSSLL